MRNLEIIDYTHKHHPAEGGYPSGNTFSSLKWDPARAAFVVETRIENDRRTLNGQWLDTEKSDTAADLYALAELIGSESEFIETAMSHLDDIGAPGFFAISSSGGTEAGIGYGTPEQAEAYADRLDAETGREFDLFTAERLSPDGMDQRGGWHNVKHEAFDIVDAMQGETLLDQG